MTIRNVTIEYFKEPFVWFGIALLLIDLLSNSVPLLKDFRGFLFVKYFYYCFFFPTLYLSASLVTEPLKKSVKEYRKRGKINAGVIIVTAIFTTLFLSSMPPQLEPHMFFSDEFNAIKIPWVVTELKAYVIVGGLVAAPASIVYTKWSVRKQLSKDKIEISDHVDYGAIFASSWMIFMVLMIIFSYLDTFHIT